MVEDVQGKPREWIADGRAADIVVSSRVRIARNLADAAFPGWGGKRESERLFARLSGLLCGQAGLAKPELIAMDTLGPVEREVLRERHLISYELAAKGAGSGLVMSEPDRVAVMINEEDHLRIQALRPGFELAEAWSAVERVDRELERHVAFAFSPRFGYLTACPSNVGTGLRAGVMVHVPGLRLMNEIEPVVKGLNRLGLAVRGAFGEGTDAWGSLYQISNQATLGVDEGAVIARLTSITAYLVRQERQARARLAEQRRLQVEDHCARAYAILLHARILTSGEAMDVLSGLRLGLEFGMVSGVDMACLNQLMLTIQPGHLQQAAGAALDSDARDRMRALRIREAIAGVRLEV